MVDFPGLPALPDAVAGLFEDVTNIIADTFFGFVSDASEQWGIFLDGEPVILADNVVSLEYREEWSISNYPVEEGSFASYNKVQRPFNIRIAFSTGGSLSDRDAFLESINAIIGDTNLYDVVSPEITYSSVSLVHQGYVRKSNSGLGLITVEIFCEQVRATANAQFSNTAAQKGQVDAPKSSSAAPQVNGGNVQPSDAPASFSDRFTFN